jgi:ribosomal protein S18 acetylase RimI-like enzyme
MAAKTETKPELLITKTVYADIPGLRAVQARIWLDTYPNKTAGIQEKWIKKITDEWLTPDALKGSEKFLKPILISPNHFHRIVKAEGSICGFVHASKAGAKQTLDAIYIDKKYQGSGIAQDMMDEAMNWLDKTKDITLEVADYNDRAIAFYKKYGFKIVKSSRHVFADKIPTVNMVRKGDN